MSAYNFKEHLERQFVEYCDFECNLIKSEENNVLHTHEAKCVVFIICVFILNENDLWSQVGKYCATKLLINLHELVEQFIGVMKNNQNMMMSGDDYDDLDNATCCHLCKRKVHQLQIYKVRDHDHSTGTYRGAVHNSCNFDYL